MRFNTLRKWLEWQSGLHPKEIELGLERVAGVWEKIHPDPFPCKFITVAGTNGKGSCVAFLDAILRAGGYRTGCYTSPHLLRYNERIRIDGLEVDDEAICRAFERVDQARFGASLTYFEFGTLAALDLFAGEKLDVVILEVGLGGRLDAVNIIDPDVALITTVDMDHTEWLGETREEIGLEKAGIMRTGRDAVYGDLNPPDSLLKQAEALRTPLSLAGRDFSFHAVDQSWHWQGRERRRHSLPFPHLRGRFQLQNASAVLMVLECLSRDMPIDQQAVRQGLQSAQLRGRFEVLGRNPQVILDVAHNVQAAEALAENLRNIYCPGRTLAVFAMLADKEVKRVAPIMDPLVDHWYLGDLDANRAMPAEKIATELKMAGVAHDKLSRYSSLAEALAAARMEAGEDDRLLVFGSFYTVGGVLELL